MRGNIYFVTIKKLEYATEHSCEVGRRPVVVVSSEAGCRTSNIVMVCPITTKVKRLSCNVDINFTMDGRQSQVLCNQILTIPKAECAEKIGWVNRAEQERIDNAIRLSLGLNDGGKHDS